MGVNQLNQTKMNQTLIEKQRELIEVLLTTVNSVDDFFSASLYEKISKLSDEIHALEHHPETANITSLMFSIEVKLPYPDPVSRHQADINIGWKRCVRFISNKLDEFQSRQSKEPVRYIKMVRGKASNDIETPDHTIEVGETVEGYLNSYHLMGCYSIQVELTQDCGNTPGCSGIIVVNVPVDKNSIYYIEGEQIESKEPIRDELIAFASRNDKYKLTNIRNTVVPAYLEMLKKDHEDTVDEYLSSKSDKQPEK
jgi:hypothetical protein